MASAARLDATNCWHRVAVSANAGTNSVHTPLPRDGDGGDGYDDGAPFFQPNSSIMMPQPNSAHSPRLRKTTSEKKGETNTRGWYMASAARLDATNTNTMLVYGIRGEAGCNQLHP